MSDNDIRVGPRADSFGTTGLLDSALSPVLGDEESGATKQAESYIKNILNQFASYNVIITLGLLSKEELNNPDETFVINGPERIILRSGGVGDSKIRTSYEQDLSIDTEYYIDDLEIDSLIGFGRDTRQTNATLFNFQIIEPYSMGLLLDTLAVTALDADETAGSYLDAPYILVIEFVGYDDAGNTILIPETKRFIPIKLTNLTFNVTAGGSIYDISAIAWGEQALSDEVQRINQDVDLVGETVADFLQLGGEGNESLTYLINQYAFNQKEAGNSQSADAYVILFPDDSGSAADDFKGTSEESDSATSSRDQEEITRIARDGINLDDIKNFAARQGNINEIGKSRVDSKSFTSGNKRFGTPDIEIEDGLAYRNGLEFNKTERYINIERGNRIQDIIENIILVSDYGKQLSQAEPDSRGMLKWFRIETATYDVNNEENINQRGRSAKIYVYLVVPYLVHVSNFVAPSQTSPGIPALEKKIPKKYEYIYSGQNDSIIDFDISFNTAFYNALQKDLSQFSQDRQLQNAFAANAPVDRQVDQSVSPPADRENTANEAAANIDFSNQPNTNSSIINGVDESAETVMSRYFNDIIVNGIDLITAEMEILGDPYFITNGGGNYRAQRSDRQTLIDGSIDYQYEEAHLLLNFKTPIDLNQTTGRMDFPTSATEPVRKFSGIYAVDRLTSTISGNKFTQRLVMRRVRNQFGEDTELNKLVSTPVVRKDLLGAFGIIQGLVAQALGDNNTTA